MIQKISIIFSLLLISINPVFAEKNALKSVLAVQSLRVKPYEQALRGFEDIFPGKVRKILLDKNQDKDIAHEIEKNKPDLVLAIGLSALLQVSGIKETPVLFIMVLDPPDHVKAAKNVTGISMFVSPEIQMDIVAHIMPQVKTVGMLYDPVRSELFVQAARQAARRHNFELLDVAIENSKNVALRFNQFLNKIDLFWMVPDTGLLTAENIEFLLLTSLENKIPIFSFSEKFAELGALFSIGIAPVDVGRQAGNLALRIIEDGMDSGSMIYAEKPVITVNMKIARKLGLSFDPHKLENIEIIR